MEKMLKSPLWSKQQVVLAVASLLCGLLLMGKNPTMGMVGLLSGVFLLIPGLGGTLKLDGKGITYRNGMFGDKTTPWSEVEEFCVITQTMLSFIPVRRSVGWKTVRSKTSMAGKAVGFLAGFNAQLPSNYGMKAQELAALLELHRRTVLQQEAERNRRFRFTA
ncbi:MAG: hypothetical protein OHK0021_17450 [Bryobacter sp.]